MFHFGFSYIGLIWLLMLFMPNFIWTKNKPSAAKAAKDSIEESTGKPVITSKKASELNHMVTAMIEKSAELEI